MKQFSTNKSYTVTAQAKASVHSTSLEYGSMDLANLKTWFSVCP